MEDNGRGRKMAQTYKIKSLKTFGVLSIIAAGVTLLILIHHVFMFIQVKKQTKLKMQWIFESPLFTGATSRDYFHLDGEYICIYMNIDYRYTSIHIDIYFYFYFIYCIYLFLFSYNCLHFLPIPPPHPSQSHRPPPPRPSPLLVSLCPL